MIELQKLEQQVQTLMLYCKEHPNDFAARRKFRKALEEYKRRLDGFELLSAV